MPDIELGFSFSLVCEDCGRSEAFHAMRGTHAVSWICPGCKSVQIKRLREFWEALKHEQAQ